MADNLTPGNQGIQRPEERDYSLDRLSEAFETSARRWELIVYPSLFAFILLAGYGFYLVYSLTRDVHYLAISVDSNMTVMASNFQSVADNMNHMTSNIRMINGTLTEISTKVSTLEPMLTNMTSMDKSMDSMDRAMDSMDRAIKAMTVTTHYMGGDMHNINRNVSRPMSFMNSFMPW
jgi:methyl-accepting chemotaxis protein